MSYSAAVRLLAPVAGLVLVLVAAACLLPRSHLPAAPHVEPARRIMGWLMLALLTATPIVVGWGSAHGPAARLWPGFALLLGGAGITIVLVLWATAMVSPWAGLRIVPVLGAWLAFWMLAAFHLRRLAGPGLAISLTLAPAMLLLAAPVTFMPLFRALAPGHRPSAIAIVANACPTLAVLDATAADYSWMQEGVMYGLTALGQDLPLSYPHWWLTALIYAAAAGSLGLLARTDGKEVN